MSCFDDFDEALEKLNLVYDDSGLAYAEVDGFIYTFSFKKRYILLCINLPEINHNERKMISGFLHENAGYIESVSFVKEGIVAHFGLRLFDEPSYLADFTQRFSKFLHSVSIEFLNPELNIRKGRKNMYIFDSVAKQVNDDAEQQEADDFYEPEEKRGIVPFILQNKIIVFAVFGILFFVSSLIYVKIASVIGYLLGTAAAVMYVKCRDSKSFLKSSLYTAATLAISGTALYFYLFLSQEEFYTFYEFTVQSLNIEYCIFNVIVGCLLALLAAYSNVPAKKKKKTQENGDF